MSMQGIVVRLLLETGASRTTLVLETDTGPRIAAEAVRDGWTQRRVGGVAVQPEGDNLAPTSDIVVEGTVAPKGGEASGEVVHARLIAPIVQGGRKRGSLLVEQGAAPRDWAKGDIAALEQARADILAELERQGGQHRAAAVDLRAAATQAILDTLRKGMDAQRCTFRQPVQAAYDFPVTFESRAEGVRPLLGDFTIVQTGQPVIVKLLRDRSQVVQDDCSVASTEPLFHVMLKHYGGMRAQIVTPFIVGDSLRGVLSVHELRARRVWNDEEKALAAEAARLIGGLFETA